LSLTDKLTSLIFSELSLGVVIPIAIGVLILLFPTVIFDFLGTIHISFPEYIWGGPEVPLQHIITVGIAEGILTCAVPIMLGIVWNRWAGGASGFLCGVLFTTGMATYYGGISATLDWLGVIIGGMLAGYIAGSLYLRSSMRGSTGLKPMLIASILAATVATIFTTQTYLWFSPMAMLPGRPYWDSFGFAYFTYIAIYGVWGIFAALGSWISSWFM
jgi:hypothetical protein